MILTALLPSAQDVQPQPKFKGQIILPPPLSAQLPDTPPQTPDVHPIFVTSQLDNTMSSNPRIDSGVAQRRPIEREMSEIHLPTLEQAQEDAMRDAQARFQSYHAQASQRAAAAATAAAIGSGSGSTSHGNDVVDLSHSPGPPAYQTLQDSPNIIKPSHSSNLSTSSSPSPSIYSSPLSVHTDLHHYSPQSSISSPLHTPKGHPIELYERDGGVLGTAGQGLLNMVHNVTTGNMQKDGGGGTFGALKGFVGGDKGKGTDEKKWVGSYGQKVYRPTHPRAPSIRQPTFKTTLSHLTRVPRRYRPFAFGLLIMLLVFGWFWGMGGIKDERAVARRHALNRQRAFVIDADSHSTMFARHPASHLTASLVRQAQQEYKAATGARDEEELLDSIFEEPVFEMSKQEELAALFSFFTSTSSNALPPIDPEAQLDPQLVLDFDYTKSTARDDLKQLEREIWEMFPIVLVGKMRDPWHREIKKLLASYKISPPPMIIEVDQRSDVEHLVPLLERLLDSDELPHVLVGGKTIGSYTQVQKLADAGTLMKALSTGGASVTDKFKKKKKKYVKDAERAESERVLSPNPILIDD